MHLTLLNHFLSIQELSKEEIDAIDETMEEQEFKKGAVLLKQGQISQKAYFVLEGIVRQYQIIEGEEKTIDFFCEGEWVLLSSNVEPGRPSEVNVECSVDCKLALGNSEKGEYLYRKFPNLETVSRKLMNGIYLAQQTKLQSYITDSPQIRYQKLMKTKPLLLQQIPQYQIASYIGVTPESLSRIRRRISKK